MTYHTGQPESLGLKIILLPQPSEKPGFQVCVPAPNQNFSFSTQGQYTLSYYGIISDRTQSKAVDKLIFMVIETLLEVYYGLRGEMK